MSQSSDSPAPPKSIAGNLPALAALLLTPLFFASNLIVGRAVVGTVAPWNLAFWRWAIAAAIMLAIAYGELKRHEAVLRAHWQRILVLGFLATVLCGGLVYVALGFTTATNATLIYTTSTIMVVVMDAVLSRRPLPPVQIVGAVAGFVGIAVIALDGDWHRLVGLRFNMGDLGILVAAIAWAAYSLMLRSGPLVETGALPTFAVTAIAGTILLFPPMLWETTQHNALPHTLEAWTAIIGLAIIPSVLAFTLYQYCVRVAGASLTAMFLYLMPPYGVVLAVLLLGEQFHAYHAVGLALILGGVVLSTRKPSAGKPAAH